MVRLKEAAEKAKIELSIELTVEVGVPFLANVGGVQKHLKFELTQAELEQIALPIVRKVDSTIKTVLIDSRLGAEDIDRLILIGGQTKMPLVRRVVEEYMGKVAEDGVDPMQCVAIGAAYQGAVLAGKLNYRLLDVTPLTLGIEDAAGTVQKIIYRNTPDPRLEDAVVHHGGGQPDGGEHTRGPGRADHGRRLRLDRAVRPEGVRARGRGGPRR